MGKKKTKKSRRISAYAALLAALLILPTLLLGWILPGVIGHLILIRGALLFVAGLLLTAILALVFRKGDARFLIHALCFIGMLGSSVGLLFRLDYAFIDLGFSPLWVIPLLISVGVGIWAPTTLCDKSTMLHTRIGYIFLCAFLAFAIIVPCALHLNYALDFSPPEEYSSAIVDKELDRDIKVGKEHLDPTTYEFTVMADGKEYDLAVTREEYNRYDEGDTYCFYRYNGALGEPFFLSKMGK
jgi:hypothetical protein